MTSLVPVALEKLGLSFSEILDFTIAELETALRTRLEREEYLIKDDWQRMRALAYYSLIAHVDQKKSSIKAPKDLFQFPWEQEDRVKLTDEQINVIDKKMEQFLTQKHSK